MEASYEGGQDPEETVAPYMDGLLKEFEFRSNDLVTDGAPAMTRVDSVFVGKNE